MGSALEMPIQKYSKKELGVCMGCIQKGLYYKNFVLPELGGGAYCGNGGIGEKDKQGAYRNFDNGGIQLVNSKRPNICSVGTDGLFPECTEGGSKHNPKIFQEFVNNFKNKRKKLHAFNKEFEEDFE